jgi:hypothetical protein
MSNLPFATFGSAPGLSIVENPDAGFYASSMESSVRCGHPELTWVTTRPARRRPATSSSRWPRAAGQSTSEPKSGMPPGSGLRSSRAAGQPPEVEHCGRSAWRSRALRQVSLDTTACPTGPIAAISAQDGRRRRSGRNVKGVLLFGTRNAVTALRRNLQRVRQIDARRLATEDPLRLGATERCNVRSELAQRDAGHDRQHQR